MRPRPSASLASSSGGSRTVGASLILLAALLTAVVGVLAKEALARGSAPLDLIAIRFALCGLLLGASMVVMDASFSARDRRGFGRSLPAGVLLCVGGVCEFEALARLPLAVVLVILFVNPVWLALYARMVKRERIGLRRLVAIFGMFAGVVLLLGPKVGVYDGIGILLALFASVAWAAVFVLLDRAMDRVSPVAAIASAMISAALLAIAIALVVDSKSMSEQLGEPESLRFAIGVGAVSSVAFLALAIGLQLSYVLDAAVVAATEPVFASVLAAVILDEVLSATQFVGAAMIVAGAVASTTARPPSPVRSLPPP